MTNDEGKARDGVTSNWSDVSKLLEEEVREVRRRRVVAAESSSAPPPTASAAAADIAKTHESGQQAASDDSGNGSGQVPVPPQPTIGLALSGGGVRSATFCLGLLRGMAQNGLLPRFDYLSTVSGGGYAGAVFGRLVSRVGIQQAQTLLASSDSLVLGWLRRHGRYLMPRGARDFGVAIASYTRGALAVHIELGVLAMLVGLVVIAPHLLLVGVPGLDATAWSTWRSAWFPLALLCWLLLAPGTLTTYWMLTDRPAGEPRLSLPNLLSIASVLAATTALVWAWRSGYLPQWLQARPAAWLVWILGGLYLHQLAVLAGVARAERRNETNFGSRHRNRMTATLRAANVLTAILLMLGLIDVLSWELTTLLVDEEPVLLGGLGVGAVLLIVVRTFSEQLQRFTSSRRGTGPSLVPRILHVVGLAAGFGLLLAWTTLVQWLVFGGDDGSSPLAALPHWIRACLIGIPPLLWLLCTSRNRDTANTSSLHNFYRGRLTRAYLATGNPGRFGDTLGGIHARGDVDERHDVTELEDGDDLPLQDYTPERKGGPIHLIGACFNQTRADRSGLYNADRRGLALTASARGISVGNDKLRRPDELRDLGTLGRWIAISGAAASPGAGSYTTTGWALLLFMAGARLGYWFDARRPAGESRSSIRDWVGNSKAGRLASEALARFRGTARPAWYLSDGGHFDNTGVHALIQRKLDFIVLADCGGDPDYEFGDIENLVRKARIDFNAEIEFYTQTEASRMFCLPGSELAVISPEKMVDNTSLRGVILARIRYCPDSPGGPSRIGTLLVVKPNLHQALDSDLLAYARRYPQFPQQSISDQFFDEAQWESYHRLGEDFGRALTPHWLSQLPGWTTPSAPLGLVTPLRRPAMRQAETADDAKPFWRPEMKSAAIGTTIGLGALGSLAIPAWQIYERMDAKKEQLRVEVSALLREDKLPPWIADGRSTVNVDTTTTLPAPIPVEPVEPVDAKAVSTKPVPDPAPDYPRDEKALIAEFAKLSAYQRLSIRRMYELSREHAGRAGPAAVAAEIVMALQKDCGFRNAFPDPVCEDRPAPGDPAAYAAGLCPTLCTRVPPDDPYWTIKPVCVDEDSALADELRRWPRLHGPALICPTTKRLPWPDGSAYTLENSVFRHTQWIAATASQTTPPVPAPPRPTAESVMSDVPAENTARVRLTECNDANGKPVTLYIQIYDEQTRQRLRSPTPALPASVVVPGIENVVSTAAARGERAPTPWRQPTMLVHRYDSDQACAQGLANEVERQFPGLMTNVQFKRLPGSLASERHVIELWLPPTPQSPAAR